MCKANAGIRRSLALDSALAGKMLATSELLRYEDETEDPATTTKLKVGFVPKNCMHFGVCVCQTPQRKDILHFWQNVSCIFRQIFFKRKDFRTPARKLLDDQCIFLHFSMVLPDEKESSLANQLESEAAAHDDAGWGDVFIEELRHKRTHMDLPSTQTEYEYHIGQINLSTYHFALFEMDRLNYQQSDFRDDDKVHVKLLSPLLAKDMGTQTATYTDMEAFAKLDLAYPWKMKVNMLFLGDDDNLSSRLDAAVGVVPAPAPNEFIVWQGSVQEAQRRKLLQQSKPRGPRKTQKKKRKNTHQEQKQTNAKRKKKEHLKPLEREEEKDVKPDDSDKVADILDFLDVDTGLSMDHGLNPYAEASGSDPGDEQEKLELEDEQEQIVSAGELSPHDLDSPEEAEDAESDTERKSRASKKPRKDLEMMESQLLADLESDLVAHPPPVPSEAKVPGEPHERAAFTRSTANREVFTIPGLGELRYYFQTGAMAAVCTRHSQDDCRKTATTMPVRSGSGRPIGHLVGWLQLCKEFDSRTQHVHNCRPTLQQRQSARAFFESLPGAEMFLEHEKRKSRTTDPNEPLKV